MLVIKDVTDLKKYLETRLEMARLQGSSIGMNTAGMIYAYEKSIEAVDALIASQTVESKS